MCMQFFIKKKNIQIVSRRKKTTKKPGRLPVEKTYFLTRKTCSNMFQYLRCLLQRLANQKVGNIPNDG